jgi:hypothetical protein
MSDSVGTDTTTTTTTTISMNSRSPAMRKPANKKPAPSAAASGPVGCIKYNDAVAEGKKIIARIEAAERGQLRLGELAAKVETKYGDRTLAKFAAELGIAKCTLERYRNVYRAYEGKLAPGPTSVFSYAALRELQKHPKRDQIIQAQPHLTKREAREKMLEFKGTPKNKQKEKDQWLRDNQKWFRDFVKAGNEAARVAGIVDLDDDEQLNKLLPAVNPDSLKYVQDGGRMLLRVANRLAELLAVDAEEASAQAHPKATAHAAVT